MGVNLGDTIPEFLRGTRLYAAPNGAQKILFMVVATNMSLLTELGDKLGGEWAMFIGTSGSIWQPEHRVTSSKSGGGLGNVIFNA